MEKSSKRGIFDGHKQENVVDYQKLFLEKMKTLLLYFVEFSKNKSILPKEYPGDCIVNESDC